ncbi:deacylase [Halobacteriales archaeon QH_8_67_27]|nr:MAG: deacylase [Halobacteriales archaeon QH_8_67_27]
MNEAEPFTYDGGRVDPGETANVRYTVSETYLGDPVRIPVAIVVGERPGPTAFLSAASHGDELNGVEVVREVAHEWDLSDLRGTLVCLPVLNVPGFIAQFHTSTRGRTNMLHVRADIAEGAVERVAKAFASNVIIDGDGAPGTLRREASESGTPTITVEMGEAHRFQRSLIDRALVGVESVLAEFGLVPTERVRWPGWRTVIEGSGEKTWLRADDGGLVDIHRERGEVVHEGETICTIANPFKTETADVHAPFTGLLVGVLENPVVYPGNPVCHLVKLDDRTLEAIERNGGTGALAERADSHDDVTAVEWRGLAAE